MLRAPLLVRMLLPCMGLIQPARNLFCKQLHNHQIMACHRLAFAPHRRLTHAWGCTVYSWLWMLLQAVAVGEGAHSGAAAWLLCALS
jgi:hypothetical protein